MKVHLTQTDSVCGTVTPVDGRGRLKVAVIRHVREELYSVSYGLIEVVTIKLCHFRHIEGAEVAGYISTRLLELASLIED